MGKTKTVKQFGVDTVYTFSSEDLSLSAEFTLSAESMKQILSQISFGRLITPEAIKDLKKEGLYVQTLEEMAEKLPEHLDLIKNNKAVTAKVEYREDGNLIQYFDNKPIYKQKITREEMLKILDALRATILGTPRIAKTK